MMVSLRRAYALHIAKFGPACYCQGGFYKGMVSMRFIPVPLHSKLNVDLLVNVVVKFCELHSQVVCAAALITHSE